MKTSWLKLIVSIVICQLAGIIGSLFTTPAINTWYESLNQPTFRPPNWLFGPVWLVLYLLMGISAYLVWQKGLDKKEVRTALIIFAVQLVLNSFWSIIFFGMKNLSFALAEILVLWLFIILTIFKFYQIDKRAALLLIPYLLWVSFASFLNCSILRLN